MCGLLDGKAAEEPELHHSTLLGVQFGQRVQRRIESQQVHGATSGQGHALEQSLLLATAPFDRAVFARF